MSQDEQLPELVLTEAAESERIGPIPARTGDIVSAVLAGLLAALVTFGPTLTILSNGSFWGTSDAGPILGLTSLWNLMVWGPSVWGVGSWWYRSTQQNFTDRTFLWRIFWKIQWVTNMLLPALLMLFCGICTSILSFSH